MSEQPLFSFRNPWFGASVGVTAAIAVLAAVAGLIWLPLAQPDLKLSGHLGRDLQRRRRAARVRRKATRSSPISRPRMS